jgi:hypothetical protein
MPDSYSYFLYSRVPLVALICANVGNPFSLGAEALALDRAR